MKFLCVLCFIVTLCFIAMIVCGCGHGRRLGTTDGKQIWIDEQAIKKAGMDVAVIIKHEQLHIDGYAHCNSRKCIMYPVAGKHRTELCAVCHPNSFDWAKKIWK